MLAISTPSVREEGEGNLTPKQDDSQRRMASDDEEDMMALTYILISSEFQTFHLH